MHTRIDVHGGWAGVTTTGQGPDVLFVHGWPTNATTWQGVTARLQASYTCHAVDLPGWAGSPSARVTFDDHVLVLEQVLDALGVEQCVVAGHDSGGLLARMLADRQPERVRGLLLSDCEVPGLRPAMIVRLMAFARLPFAGLLLRSAFRTGPVRRSGLLGFGGCFDEARRIDGPFFERTIRPLLEPERTRGALAFLRAFDLAAMDELASVHERLRCPVQLIWGEHDPVFPLSEVHRMTRQFGGPVDLAVLPGGRLFAHEEFPDTYAEVALDALSRFETSTPKRRAAN